MWYVRCSQYIKILTVCLRVTEVGCSWGGTRLVMRDLQTEPRPLRRMFENIGHGCNRGAAVERTQSGSSSRSRRNRGAAVEADTIREQQLKQTQSGSSMQLKRTQSGS